MLHRVILWLVKVTHTPLPVSVTPMVTETVVMAAEPARCDTCGIQWTEHACPAVTCDGDVAACLSCGDILPKGTIRQHTGAWLCSPCKGKIALGR